MKKQITFNIETEKDDEIIKAYLIYQLRMFNLKKEDIKLKSLEDGKE